MEERVRAERKRGGEETIRDGKNDKGTEEITYDRRKGKVREWKE